MHFGAGFYGCLLTIISIVMQKAVGDIFPTVKFNFIFILYFISRFLGFWVGFHHKKCYFRKFSNFSNIIQNVNYFWKKKITKKIYVNLNMNAMICIIFKKKSKKKINIFSVSWENGAATRNTISTMIEISFKQKYSLNILRFMLAWYYCQTFISLLFRLF